MARIPLCRSNEYTEIVASILTGIRIIVISGPASSGKTTTIQAIVKNKDLDMRKIHMFCETDMDNGGFYYKLSQAIAPDDKKARSFQQFVDYYDSPTPTAIFIDSFDLLGDLAKQLFTTFKSAVESNIMSKYYFIFISRTSPVNFITDPLTVFNIDFAPYTDNEIFQVVRSCGKHEDNDQFDHYLEQVVNVSRPLTHDIRDIIYITYKLQKSEIKPDDKLFPKLVLHELRAIRETVQSRIVDLPKIANLLLIASYIASHTSSLADLAHLSRSAKRQRKHPNFLQEHEYVSINRIFAIAKALNFHYCDDFDFDYSAYTQIQNLYSLNLIEIRGDIRLDPKIKCLATEDEVKSAGLNVEIDVNYYVSEDMN
ncbi:hypothetical protein TVAG_399280 [Trichomonas vaginalis G3]|uniref:Origin recognition complex subunit 5 C-terminal domain-containing protein n=1 Tax=Trichomonas vaginalis (strain ATCC PRA-98 / G3) TaxID=412133 RepID=A2E5W6_TRIV3|nr:origin recognition complex subunit 5 family [Trichomonas vaginalis G3]EAY11923.1 hypothetical protein TVAG_399280 [Trichomonas vaginalis G3]KAI5530412.1 origin recognition complex subunit 5 family [Trichomonas vaginalis G3]|eukprot:XP_001324146.1 hypothetical protein [Trichomonas vaginalis G3]